MALPPKGDPQRPLQLAIRSTRSLGTLFLILGGCVSIPLFVDIRAGAGARTTPAPIARTVFSLLFYLAPGMLYLVCSVFLARRHVWAVVTTMTIAGLQILGMAFSLAVMLYEVIARQGPTAMFLWIPLLIIVVLILALGQLEYHLGRALQAIRKQQIEAQRGFEPMPVEPELRSRDTPSSPDT